MSKYDDEFNNVAHGLPPRDTGKKAGFSFIALFGGVGVVLAILIFVLQDVIKSSGLALAGQYGFIPEQIIINCILALLVGSIQAWIFKAKINSRIPLFVSFSLLGGTVAGLIGGTLINSGMSLPFVLGLVNGAVSGGITSYCQNSVMKNSKLGTEWFGFNIISWAIIFSIGWAIGWEPGDVSRLAFAAIFMMIMSGVSLVVFLKRFPQIEFS